MKTVTLLPMILLFFFMTPSPLPAAQALISRSTDDPPQIDGFDNDQAWRQTKEIITHDDIADIPVVIKTVHNHESIFFLVSFPDPDESRTHKSWTWDPALDIYRVGKDREDTFVIKWHMEPAAADLSIYGDQLGKADIWYWKACRTDPAGYADDKMQILNETEALNAVEIIGRSGKTRYLYRQEDAGKSAYKINMQTENIGLIIPRYTIQAPSGSRADVKAKGNWQDGRWTIEFSRFLDTGHDDDLQLSPGKVYHFGISRYEIAGRPANPELSQPLYGSGDTSEIITLTFAK
jgi:hypothetical protein